MDMFHEGQGQTDTEASRPVWTAPRIVTVLPMADTEGNGFGGTDFASELS